VIEPILLNARAASRRGPPLAPLAVELRTRLQAIIAAHADPATGYLDYRAIRAAADFGAFVEVTRGLAGGRSDELKTPEEQIAFWLNLYNALTLHAIIALDIKNGVGEVDEFFRRVRYDVGGDHFSLVDIEHGVLRQNRPSRNQPEVTFPPRDRRLRWLVGRFDPRVHFALMCGARSCPPIRAYDAARLDAQLDQAARGSVSSDVEVDRRRGRVTLSRIFYWYEDDFSGTVDFVLRHLDPGPTRDWLAAHRADVRVRYRAYDWGLNDAGIRA
jgi:hypothetical protein